MREFSVKKLRWIMFSLVCYLLIAAPSGANKPGYVMPSLEVQKAIKAGDLQKVKSLLKKSKEPLTFVHMERAARAGQLEVFKYFESKDIFLIKDQTYLLHNAAASGNLEMVKHIVKFGVPVDLVDPKGVTPIFNAATSNNPQMIKWFIDQQVEFDRKNKEAQTPLMQAVLWDAEESVKMLIAHGANINIRDGDKWNLLHMAALNGNPAIVLTLMDKQLSLESKTYRSRTPLHIAAQYGKVAVVEFLLKQGVNLDSPDGSGDTPLHLAVEHGYIRVAKLLIRHGANPSLKNKSGFSAIVQASHGRRIELVKWMLSQGISHGEEGEYTLLHSAAFTGNIETIQILINRGIEINMRNQKSKTALDIANSKHHKKVQKLLKKHGGEIADEK